MIVMAGCIRRNPAGQTRMSSVNSNPKNLTIGGVDHAPLSAKHDQTAQEYIDRWLKRGVVYDETKIQAFIERLIKEKQSLAEDLYETRLIEKIELEVTTFKKAVKSAKKKGDVKKSALLAMLLVSPWVPMLFLILMWVTSLL